MKRRKEMQKRVFAQNLGIIFVGSSGRAPGDLRGFVPSQLEKRQTMGEGRRPDLRPLRLAGALREKFTVSIFIFLLTR